MLNPRQTVTLHRSILDTFGFRQFEQMVRHGIGVPIERLVRRGEEAGMVLDVIQAAERAGWTRDLVRYLYDARPDVSELVELYQSLGLATEVAVQHSGAQAGAPLLSTEVLERTLPGIAVDLGTWRRRLGEIEACVCRVEVSASTMATGFLVRPDLVLTCFHVVKDLIGQDGRQLRFRFDYRGAASVGDGVGVVVHAQGLDWLVDASPPAAEMRPSGNPGTPGEDELDLALIRLERPLGAEPLDPSSSAGAPRGWVPIPATPPPIMAGAPLMIAQYAHGGPLRVILDTEAVLGLNANGTRVFYTTDTEPGAAGAPCFDRDGVLIAMHQGRADAAASNRRQGIPVSAIRDRFLRLDLKEVLGMTEGARRPASAHLPDAADAGPPEPGPVQFPDDLQRGRWGGAAEQAGRRLGVRVTDLGKGDFFTFDAFVEATDGTALEEPVVFHLHDTYPRPVIWIRRIRLDEGRAYLYRVSAYGVYVIGAQAKDARGHWIGLEFDLAILPELPSVYLSR
jgi:hypothetical protein